MLLAFDQATITLSVALHKLIGGLQPNTVVVIVRANIHSMHTGIVVISRILYIT